MKSCLRLCGLIASLDMVLLKLLLFELVYVQESMLLIVVNLDAYRLARQNDLSAIMYHDMMMNTIDKVTDKRIQALKEIEKDKASVAWAYNKEVKSKSFQVEELVWKTILPLETKSNSLASGHQAERVYSKCSKWCSENHIC